MHASRKRSVMAVLGIKIRRAFHEGIEQVAGMTPKEEKDADSDEGNQCSR